jgi:hypothetical protein
MTDYLVQNPSLLRGRRICELGAGAGLPSIVAALAGAETVVVTDYPDVSLIENLRWNGDVNLMEGYHSALNVQASHRLRCQNSFLPYLGVPVGTRSKAAAGGAPSSRNRCKCGGRIRSSAFERPRFQSLTGTSHIDR